MSRFAILFIRYVAAIAVACIVSFAVFDLLLFTLALWAGIFGFLILCLAVGFCGVFSGTFCLPRASRRSGSVVLLVLGLVFYIQMLLRLNIARGEDNSFPLVWLLPLAAGGFGAVYFFRRQPPNTALEPTAAAPSVSDKPDNPKAGSESTAASGGGGSAFGR